MSTTSERKRPRKVKQRTANQSGDNLAVSFITVEDPLMKARAKRDAALLALAQAEMELTAELSRQRGFDEGKGSSTWTWMPQKAPRKGKRSRR